MRTEVTTRMEFECSYILNLWSVSQLRSHRYRVEVTVTGPQRLEDHGMIIEFNRLRQYLGNILPDKRFIVDGSHPTSEQDFLIQALKANKIICYDLGQSISVENLCQHLAEMLQDTLNEFEPGVIVENLKLRENSDSFASWSR